MKKFICSVCGYVYEGEEAPEKCPQCGKMLFKKNTKKPKIYCENKEFSPFHLAHNNGSNHLLL